MVSTDAKLAGAIRTTIGRIAFALLVVVNAPAAADEMPELKLPMRFVLARAADCEPSCAQWISAQGQIETDSAAKFSKFLKTIGKAKYPVVFHSGGGSVEAALAIAKLIRAAGLDTAIGKTEFLECDPAGPKCQPDPALMGAHRGAIRLQGAGCASACPFALSGGVRRFVGPRVFVGVHRFTQRIERQKIQYRIQYRVENGRKREIARKVVSRKKVGTFVSEKIAKAFVSKVRAHLKAMGVSEKLYDLASEVPAEKLRQVTLSELVDLNLATGGQDVLLIADTQSCRTATPEANCVTLAGLDRTGADARNAGEDPYQAFAMQFAVVRRAGADCAKSCPHWIAAEGWITRGTRERFAAFLKSLKRMGFEKAKLPLVISSLGGDIDAAVALGTTIRQSNLDVAVARTEFQACSRATVACREDEFTKGLTIGFATGYGGHCYGVCPVLLAAGVRRIAGEGANFNMYRVAPELAAANRTLSLLFQSEASPLPDDAIDKMKRYFREGGVAPEVYELATFPGGRTTGKISDAMLFATGLVNSREPVEAIGGRQLCEQKPPAANCLPPRKRK